jgi:hypothetical protein
MLRPRIVPIALGIALCFLVSSCDKNAKEVSLHDRLAAEISKHCSAADTCLNPIVLATDTGFDVTIFNGTKPDHVHVPANYLASYLQTLPTQVWPRGPSIIITLTDDAMDPHAVQENFATAQKVCRALGLEVQIRAGG